MNKKTKLTNLSMSQKMDEMLEQGKDNLEFYQ